MKTLLALSAAVIIARIPVAVSLHTFDFLLGLVFSLLFCAFVSWVMLMTRPQPKPVARRATATRRTAQRSTLPARIATVLCVDDQRNFPISCRTMPAIAY